MSFVASFSVSQNANNITQLNIVDTSTGSDTNIVGRQIFLITGDGTYIVPTGTTTNYIAWLLANANIYINVLTQDYAINIIVNWVNSAGTTLYTSSQLCLFTAYSEQFLYYLCQLQASTPSVVQDNNYFSNVMKLRVLVDNAITAISIGADQASAQSSLNQAAYMISQQNIFFLNGSNI